jgi:CRP-like cAMP-binding protein
VATRDTELLKIDREHFDSLARSRPQVAISLLMALGKAQASRLRWSAAKIRDMAQR